MKTPLRVIGVGRMIDNDRALLVMFDRVPTDDEFREFHESMRARATVKRPLGLAQEVAIAVSASTTPPAPAPRPASLEPIAIALAENRRVMAEWHRRAVELGTDGVADVLHAAEVAKKRGGLHLIAGALEDVAESRASDRPELLSESAAKNLISDALRTWDKDADNFSETVRFEDLFARLKAAGLLRCAGE